MDATTRHMLTDAAARLCPYWSDCTPEEQAILVRDMYYAYSGDGLEPEVYWEAPMSKEDVLCCAMEEHEQRLADGRAI